ncbi:Ribonuclease H-like superfamily [Sesbania bispinosa]|nr:Ribonuclease H-like superfamily [Sesbania bispinosa]
MASKMVAKFEKYWSVIHGIMGIASVLDPRYKLNILEYFFPKLYGSSSSIEINNMKKLCYSLFEDYQNKTVGVVENSGAQLNDNESNTDGLNVSNLLTGYDLFVNDDTNESQSKSELDLYLEEKVLPRSATFDILGWWKTNGIKYPTLRKIAKDILAIPISIVASESAFSTGGRLLSSHRSRLHQDTVEALMCAQSWLKHEKEGPKQYIETKDKRLQPVGESDSDDEVK